MISAFPPTLVSGNNFRPVGYFGRDADTHDVSDKTFTSLEGFVGRDPVRSEIVLAIRGSESIRNWIADLTLSKTSVSISFHETLDFLAIDKDMLQRGISPGFHVSIFYGFNKGKPRPTEGPII